MKKLFSTSFSQNAIHLNLLIIRIIFGGLMIPHGLKKINSFDTLIHKFSDPLGVGSAASLSLTIFAELVCAALVIAGLFTRLAAIPLIIAMAVAVFYAHNGEIFGKGEMGMLYMAAFVVILIAGPGKYSLDKRIERR